MLDLMDGSPDAFRHFSNTDSDNDDTSQVAENQRHIVEGRRTWSRLTANARIVRCEGSHASELRYSHPVIYAILETIGGQMRVECVGGEAKDKRAHSAHLSLVPAGTTIRLDAPRINLFREVVIEIVQRPSSETSEPELEAAVDFAPRTMILDQDLLWIAELICADCLCGRPGDQVYGDSLSIILLKALSRFAGECPGPRIQGGLAPWQLRRVTEFLETHLVDGARLDALARLVSLSPSYLIRAFKVSTGMTPHQWLRTSRIRRAEQLLIEGDRSLAIVAQETGFSDQAHLTRIFGQVTGESPGAWRRARLAGPRAAALTVPRRV